MAITIKIIQARQTAMGLAPQPSGGYAFVVDYAVQTTLGGVVHDLLVGGAQQRVSAPVQTGKPMPTPAQVAVLIRQDCQSVFGGQPDKVVIDGTAL